MLEQQLQADWDKDSLKDVLQSGRMMEEKNFLSAREAAPPMQKLFAEIDPDFLASRGLQKFAEVGEEMLGKITCLPTTTLMAIRHLTGQASLSLAEFYELGIYAHINDRSKEDGAIEKGFPSFHKDMLDTYLRYALEFAKIAGLAGGIITGFSNLEFMKEATQNGVALLSVDNLFIPNVINPDIDASTFKPSRHAELVHGTSGENLLVSDVTNFRNGVSWDTQNRTVPQAEMEKFITCPRLNDTLTRAVILTKNASDWEAMKKTLAQYGTVEQQNHNPILSPFFNKGVTTALESIRTLANQGLAQWEMMQKEE